MNRSLVATGALVLVAACAHNKTLEPLPPVAPSPQLVTETRVGIVSLATPNSLTVLPVPPGPTQGDNMVGYSPATLLLKTGQPAPWSEVGQGTPVRVVYAMQNGMAQAQQIEILTGPEADSVMEKGKAAYGNVVMPPSHQQHQQGQKPPPPMNY